MNRLYLLINSFTILTSCFFYGQNSSFIYEHRYISDSTNRKVINTEIMTLSVNKDRSEFYSMDKFKSDSTLLVESKKGVFMMPPNKLMNSDRVRKQLQSTTIDYITIISNSKYLVSQNIILEWNILQEFDNILGYRTQKARTEFGGRKWIAWFTKEISIQDGPYKFYGLPGLILKIEDIGKNHTFELKGIRKTAVNFVYPELGNFKLFKISNSKYEKIFKNYRKYPIADLAGTFPDYTNSTGVLISGRETERLEEKRRKDQIKKDNNIIELNLLKK
ncbi:GLPGLI family protein [Chryseobacterium sp. Leaf404]|uniref:GLPGLI family protein n=2 Tax=unclassified Chryseobacterium TaxID=2593645 RepID=UPI000B0CF844|nr:GLPGLI family protein [Chryseobacterium sp. Leaf404]